MKRLVLLFIFSFFLFSYSQTDRVNNLSFYKKKIDTLKKQSKYKDALIEAKDYYAEIPKDNSVSQLEVMLLLSEMYYKNNKQDSSAIIANKVLQICSVNNLDSISNKANLILANILYRKFEDKKAIDLYTQIIKTAELKNIRNETLMRALFNKGLLLLRTYSVKDTTYIGKAENYYKQAIQVAKEIKNEKKIYYGYYQLGGIYGQRKNYDKAIEYLNLCYAYFKNANHEPELADVCNYFGIIYNYKKDFTNAKRFYTERYNILTQDKFSLNQKARANWSMGAFNKKFNNYKVAIPYFEKALMLFKDSRTDQIAIEQSIVNDLAFCNEQLNNYELSTDYYRQALSYQDSLMSNLQIKSTLESETKYETEKKEKEIALLTSQKQLTAQQNKNQRNIFIGILALALMTIWVLFYLFKNRQKTTKKLQELDKAKSTFFANISHEFKTPLTLIKGPIEDQLSTNNLHQNQRQNLLVAQRNTNRLNVLVDQLLALSKLESGMLKLQVSQSDFSQFLKFQLESFNYISNEKHIAYKVQLDDTNRAHWFDKDVLQKIIFNIVGNAFKYTPEEGSITISSVEENDNYTISILNSDTYLSPKQQKDIFTRFYQANTNNIGTGIGLALTKELVELHHGTISVESNQNSGTQFTVQIPITKNKYTEAEIMVAAIKRITDKKLTVTDEEVIAHTINTSEEAPILLIIDDHTDIRNYISTIFENEYQVLLAENGKVGIAKAITHIPDIIISDIMMPEQDGLSLTQQLKENELTSHIPIGLLTAKTEDEYKLDALQKGADSYITKPFSTNYLKLTITNLLNNRRKVQQRFLKESILKPIDIDVSSVEEKFLARLQEVLNSQLTNPKFNIEILSQEIGVSRMQLYRKLKAITGQTTSKFIRTQRLKLAAKLIKVDGVSSTEACYSVGFNEPSYFSKCFKQEFGCSPTKYAKM